MHIPVVVLGLDDAEDCLGRGGRGLADPVQEHQRDRPIDVVPVAHVLGQGRDGGGPAFEPRQEDDGLVRSRRAQLADLGGEHRDRPALRRAIEPRQRLHGPFALVEGIEVPPLPVAGVGAIRGQYRQQRLGQLGTRGRRPARDREQGIERRPVHVGAGDASGFRSPGTACAAAGRINFRASTGSFLGRPPSDKVHPAGGSSKSQNSGVSGRNPGSGSGVRSICSTRTGTSRDDRDPSRTNEYAASTRTFGSGSSRARLRIQVANEARGPSSPMRNAASARVEASPVHSRAICQ